MATNNAIDAPLPLTVPNGGTGRATGVTAYGTVCAGTSATSAQQTVSPGTAGNVLTSNGASALPSYQAPAGGTAGLTWLASVVVSGSPSTVSFPNLLTATYDNYLVIYENYAPSATAQLKMVVGTGATPTYQATSYASNCLVASGSTSPSGSAPVTTFVNLSGAANIASTGTGSGFIYITNANSINNNSIIGSSTYPGTSFNWWSTTFSYWSGGIVLTSLQFSQSTGTFTTGTFKLYGYTN